MTDASPLIVPMTVEALVVNDKLRQGPVFVRPQMTYNSLQYGDSGQPSLQGDTDFSAGTAAYYDGIYLKWRLPRALRHGYQHAAAGRTHFPHVPNRWIVVRFGGPLTSRTATAWIVESDYVWAGSPPQGNVSQEASRYVEGAEGQNPVSVWIGRNVPLGTWAEPGTSLGLTAVAPGNPAFGFFQPQNNNVFSFVDVLGAQTTPETLSYLVFGWYSVAADDPLAAVAKDGFTKVMDNLGWSLPTGTDKLLSASWTVLAGSVTGVGWQTATIPPGGVPTGGTPVSIAAGNTSVEALTALVTSQSPDADAELLEAFQLDVLDVLDEPDGAGKLADNLQASFFKRFSGGYGWDIVDAPGTTAPVDPGELATELAWLATLNQAQADLDAAIRELAALQLRLYQMWWKYTVWGQKFAISTSVPGPDGHTPMKQQDLANELNPATSGMIAQQVAAQMTTVKTLLGNVPHGSDHKELAAAIRAYEKAHHLPKTRVLKRTAAPPFYEPNNPVVLIAGAGASGIVTDPSSTVCRFPSQLVTGFKYGGGDITAATQGLTVPEPNLSGVSGVPWSSALATALVNEAFFTDLNNDQMISAAVPNSTPAEIRTDMESSPLNTYPQGAVEAWAGNPWHPLLLFFEVEHYPIEYGTVASPNWTFDGSRYVWNGDLNSVSALGPSGAAGVIQLTPAAAFNMGARLQAYLDNNPQLPADEIRELQALLQLIKTQGNDWDLLSQSLDGFNEQLRLGMAGVFTGPGSTSLVTTPPLPQLIGPADGYPPNLPTLPRRLIPPSNFLPWRAGQFHFTNLAVVDEWGQALWPIDPTESRYETVFVPQELMPVVASNAVPFTLGTGPIADRVSPALVAQGATPTLTVTGSGFSAGATVLWNGSPLTTTVVSATELTAALGSAQTGAAATAQVSVRVGSQTSGNLQVVVSSGPAIGSLDPALVQAGTATTALVRLTVEGVGFGAGDVVQWQGNALETGFVSGTELEAAVPANYLTLPGTAAVTVVSGNTVLPPATLTVAPGAAIGSISPASAQLGSAALTLTVEGVGFEDGAAVAWNGEALATTFVSATQLTATVPATPNLSVAGPAEVTEQFGHRVLPDTTDSFVQLPPGLLQPARLDFDLISATDDTVVFGPSSPGADPVCGWVLPNHLDGSLMAYDSDGGALGEMSVGVTTGGQSVPCWAPAPGSKYQTLAELAAGIPHFGAFMQALGVVDPTTFTAFLGAIDETLWTTVPMDAVFDRSLAVLIGRPLAMVRSRLQFELDGPPYPDPSWQYTFEQQPNTVTTFEFAIELGNVAQLDDGLIGYFAADDYSKFNVVDQSGAPAGKYLTPIGADGNYIGLPFDGTTQQYLSMLVDPRGPVHATTAILPTASVALPPQFVTDALDAMNVTFRLNGALTDQSVDPSGATTVLLPLPAERAGTWSWLENDPGGWTTYPIAPDDATARLTDVPPVLRRGLLQLSKALDESNAEDARGGTL